VYIHERRQVKPQRGKEDVVLVEIRARHGRLNRSLEERLERRLHFALARFGGRIRRISAFLEDINGPRGGEDPRCRIEVSLVPSGTIKAEATDAEVESAVGRAAERVAYGMPSIASAPCGRGRAARQARATRRKRISERMKRDE
jgi:hypothetical protein